MKAVMYARVSSKEQEQEGYSIPAQIKLLNDYAVKNNLKVVEEFIDAETAKQAGREHFNKMLDFIKTNPDIKIILCEKTDRLSRNFWDIAHLTDLLKCGKISIVLVKENKTLDKDSPPGDLLYFGMMSVLAKNHIDNLSLETKKGLTEKAEQGIFPALAPLGYKNCEAKKDGKTLRYIEIDEERGPFMQKAFRLYATGDYSLKLLSKMLYDEGLRSGKGNKVTKGVLHALLHNPVYYGAFMWGKKLYQGTHKPLISKELFDMVQELFSGHTKTRIRKRDFAYSGLMACGKCGCAISAQKHKGRYVYYHCTGFKGNCGQKYIREEEITNQFGDIVHSIHIDDETLSLVKQALLDSHQDEVAFQQKRLQALTAQNDPSPKLNHYQREFLGV